MPAEFAELADYNARVAKGILHAPEYQARMAALQERFDQWHEDLRKHGHLAAAGDR
jgi:hypothetical protein